MQHPRPFMKIHSLESGTKHIKTTVEHGVLEASISFDTPDIIDVECLYTDLEFRRQGIASTLIRASIRGSAAADENLVQARFGIINPVVLPLLRNIFDNSINWYASQGDAEVAANPIDWDTANDIAVSRLKQANAYTLQAVEFPADFDPGVHALATLHPEQYAGWVMPNIVFIDY